MVYLRYIVLVCFIIHSTHGFTQEFKKVLPLPEKFVSPVSISEGDEYHRYLSQRSAKTTQKWVVINDRHANKTYVEPDESSREMRQLEFLDQFLVLEEEDYWIRIGKTFSPPKPDLTLLPGTHVEDFGWVKKEKMLLWTSALRDPRTRIFQKSLILYTAEAANRIVEGKAKTIPFFKGPGESFEKLSDRSLYEFYFILKKENGFYLLAKNDEVFPVNLEVDVVGWVAQSQQADWNTRLALEPNFSDEAIKERRSNKDFQFKCYTNLSSAQEHYDGGLIDDNAVLMNADPVNEDHRNLAKDGKRYPGRVMRLPALKYYDGVFETGVIGAIRKNKEAVDDVSFSNISSEIDEMRKERTHFDLLFVVEASAPMREWKQSLIEAIYGLRQQLADVPYKRFSIAFYNNADIENGNTYFNQLRFTEDIDKVKEYIENEAFGDTDFSGHTAQMYAIQKGVTKAGFREFHSNLMFVIGQRPDFSQNGILKLKCQKKDCEEGVSPSELSKQLARFKIQTIAINPFVEDQAQHRKFVAPLSDLILESAKQSYSRYRKSKDVLGDEIEFSNPFLTESEELVQLENGTTKGFINMSSQGLAMSTSELSRSLFTHFGEIYDYQKKIHELLSRVIDGGEGLRDINDVAMGEFLAPIFDRLDEAVRRSGQDYSSENLKTIIEKKVRLYTLAYVPKNVYGSNYDMLTPVLFFPRRGLQDYIQELRQLVELQSYPIDQIREKLSETLIDLYNKYAGNQKITRDTDLNDLRRMLVGEGFDFSEENSAHNFALKKIMSSRVKREEIDGFLNHIAEKYRVLEAINRDDSYEFKFRSHESKKEYFWIPFDMTF